MFTDEYKNDENKLLEVILDKTIFTPNKQISHNNKWLRGHSDNPARPDVLKEGFSIELIVRPECNQHCKYCYIANYGDKLYPIEERVNNEAILNNLSSLLDYFINTKNTFINHYELFAGDLFYDNLFFDIMDTFYKYYAPLWEEYKFKAVIVIPCNCSFINYPDKIKKFEEYFEKMKSIGIDIYLSYSGDGKYATDAREQHPVSDEFYDTLGKFLHKYRYCCHPMISIENIDNYKQNFDWWLDFYKKYEITPDFLPMFLEVRNDNWSQDKIDKYIDLLRYMIKRRLELCNNNIDDFTYQVFGKDWIKSKRELNPLGYNDIIKLYHLVNNRWEYEQMSCSIQNLVHITLNNLSIVPCHRTSYPQFIAGYFKQDENNKIIGMEAKNLTTWTATHFCNSHTFVKCIACAYQDICQKGCLGAQFESNGELFNTAAGVCNLFKAKFTYLITTYNNLGVFDSALKQNLIDQETYDYYQNILEQLNRKD